MIARDDIEHPLCAECGERHPRHFVFNRRSRGWHDKLDHLGRRVARDFPPNEHPARRGAS